MRLAVALLGSFAPLARDQLLRKNFWLVVLPLVAIAALLNAQAVTQLVGISLTPDEKSLAAPPPVAKTVPMSNASARNVSAEPILSRNPFDHVTGSLKPPVVDDNAVASTTLDTSDPFNAPQCDGVKVLVIAASNDPDWYFAAVTGAGETKTVLRRRGGEI